MGPAAASGGWKNTLHYGDNLDVLREAIDDASVDLIYLDPPFNSNADYNVLYRSPAGHRSEAQVEAFKDTWNWTLDGAEKAYDEVLRSPYTAAAAMLRAMRQAIGENDMMAYLAMMAVRLIELHRVLKPTGSLYLHCDPTASHYLKVLLDAIFGVECFVSEIIWKRTNSRSTSGRWPRYHDTILQFGRSRGALHNIIRVPGSVEKVPHTLITGSDGEKYQTYELTAPGTREGESGQPWRGFDPRRLGRHWGNLHAQMDEWNSKGLIHWPRNGGFPRRRAESSFVASERLVTVGDVWADIDRLNQSAQERLGYPTQKPVALLERIVAASSNPGDVVLDPFCGCGTAIHAAEKLGRRWIGIDVTHLSIALIERRLRDAFPGIEARYTVEGTPKDLAGALDLAARDKYQFQWWAVGQVGARPYKGKKKGADGGIDGILYFKADRRTDRAAVVSVKGGETVGVGAVRDLVAVLDRERGHAELGILLCAALPTRAMEKEAAAAGFYTCEAGTFPRIQIVTLAEIFQGRRPKLPFGWSGGTFKAAAREDLSEARQHELL